MFPKILKYSFKKGVFVLGGESHCRAFCVNVQNIRAARTREHPSDDSFHPIIKQNKSADQRVSSCSLPPKATVAMAATRLSLRRQREKHTNKTTHGKWRLELFPPLWGRVWLIYGERRCSCRVELGCNDNFRSGTACVSVLHHYRHATYVHCFNFVICS